MNAATRTAGFGAEVKRRIMLGTYALSAGYYDAYYGKAQKVRTLIIRDFDAAYERFDLLLSPTSPTTAFPLGAKTADPLDDVPERRVHDPVEPGRPPGHVGAVRHRRRRPARRRAGAGAARSARRRCSASPPSLEARRSPMTRSPRRRLGDGHRPRGARRAAPPTTKMFCGCPNQFGDEPNTNICPVCLGLPGSLPVLNEQAVELRHAPRRRRCTARSQPSIFPRKNYFYPDMPKDYQVTQYDQPINVDGWLELPDGHARRHRAGPHRGGHRQVDPRRRRRPHPRRRVLARRLQPGRRAAASRS